MTNYNQGDVLLLMKFPQTNLEREIKRPALVLADLGDEDIIVVRITGELYQTEYDYVIKNWCHWSGDSCHPWSGIVYHPWSGILYHPWSGDSCHPWSGILYHLWSVRLSRS